MTMHWTDTSVCYGHPEYRAQAGEEALLRAMDEAAIHQAWTFGYEAVATHAFEQANRSVKAPLSWAAGCPRPTRTSCARSFCGPRASAIR